MPTTTISPIAPVVGLRFTATLDHYTDSELGYDFYALDGAIAPSLNGVGDQFVFVTAPATYFTTNPARWAAFYAATLDTMLGTPTETPNTAPIRDGI